MGLFNTIKNLLQQKFMLLAKEEAISIAGFVITYFALASSRVQLPHYIFVVFPFASIITANFLFGLLFANRWKPLLKPLLLLHSTIFIFIWIGLILLSAKKLRKDCGVGSVIFSVWIASNKGP